MTPRWTMTAMLGSALIAGGCACHSKNEKSGAEPNEIRVTMDQVPPAVKDTFARESAGATVAGIDRETRHGKPVYESDAVIGGKTYEIKVADDGTLLSKKLDTDDDEKSGGKD